MAATVIDSVQAEELVFANRILYRQGVVDAFGHVSARCNANPERFYLARGVAPGRVTQSDLLVYGLDGEAEERTDEEQYSERYIHAAIYAARPDVMGVVHSHSPSIIPFTVTQIQLQPIWTLSSFLGDGVGRYDPQERLGDSDLLVKSLPLGKALATELASMNVALMRGHGSVVVGRSVREAVSRAIYTEMNAKLQSEAMRMGGSVKYLTPGEAQFLNAHTKPDVRRPWDLWVWELDPCGKFPI